MLLYSYRCANCNMEHTVPDTGQVADCLWMLSNDRHSLILRWSSIQKCCRSEVTVLNQYVGAIAVMFPLQQQYLYVEARLIKIYDTNSVFASCL